MAPSAKILEGDLQKATRHLYETDEDNLTVNAVRKRAEEMRDLDEGFFAAPEWKAKSKTIITEFLEQLHNDAKVADESDDQTASSPKPRAKPKATNGVKRSSPSGDKPAPKRQRKAPAAKPTKKKKPTKKAASDSELSEEEEESELSDLSEDEESAPESDSSEDEEPPPKKRAKKAAPKKVAKKVANSNSESELSDPDSSTEEEKPKSKPKSQAAKAKIPARPKSKSKVVESDSEAEKMIVDNDKEEGAKTSAEPKASAPDTTVKTGDIINSDSELSSVIDEPPPKKRGKGTAAKGKPKTATPKAPKELSADDEEIKKLQGHLVKCGIRKIWGIELKKYGDDTKAKIRHLRGMLADAGMSGRFSEARAKEIKEQRELMADLEAVQDMNALWGESGKGGRASRSRANRKSLKEDSGDDDDENDENDEGNDEDEGGGETKANPRVSKRMTDLAFLGDESESD